MQLVLPNDMLHKVDMMSMSHGLEVRVPMLDHTIVDFMFTLPSEYKIDSNQRKKLLRKPFYNILPQEILAKPKHGFEIPLLPWLRTSLKLQLNETLSKSSVNRLGLFDFATIEKLNHKLQSVNPSESATHLWTLFVFQYWCNKYLL
jgi:asparagine synthase (glutamine-hydrolysing)